MVAQALGFHTSDEDWVESKRNGVDQQQQTQLFNWDRYDTAAAASGYSAGFENSKAYPQSWLGSELKPVRSEKNLLMFSAENI